MHSEIDLLLFNPQVYPLVVNINESAAISTILPANTFASDKKFVAIKFDFNWVSTSFGN